MAKTGVSDDTGVQQSVIIFFIFSRICLCFQGSLRQQFLKKTKTLRCFFSSFEGWASIFNMVDDFSVFAVDPNYVCYILQSSKSKGLLNP
mmetsp:Transcript_16597/g.41580  ORF Transcript_16597/g.41580 Transcript_16597/m.41580 type:complete len:90 (-) Transcript_16597:713-982(-)